MGPRFSVVLPVDNRADQITKTVVGVLAQTFGDFELIAIDLGTDETTRDAIHMVSDQRVRLVKFSNPELALSEAFAQCSGGHVAVIDADTEVRPPWLARCGKALDRIGSETIFCGGAQHSAQGRRSAVPADPRSARPGSYLAPRETLQDIFDCATPPSSPASLATQMNDLRCGATTPVRAAPPGSVVAEELVDWFEQPPRGTIAQLPLGERLRLRLAWDAIDTLCESPIPDVELLARYATIGGVSAARLSMHREARRLFGIARSAQPGELKPAARWAVAHVPPLSKYIWTR